MELPQYGARFAGKYQIALELGRGGFATVFAAHDLDRGLDVALKVLRPDADGTYDNATTRRFVRELDVLGRLRDPHTVRLWDSGKTADGLLWAAFERIPGSDLSELLASAKRLSIADVEHVLRQVLLSLREAHLQGLLHRDLKPENLRVFQGPEGPLTVKVIDFGIARATDGSHPSVTKTGEFVGTPRYMSPEQLRVQDLDARSDLYTLGLIGLEMVAGREALGSYALQEQLERLLRDMAFPVPDLGPDGARLRFVISKLIATAPEQRFQTANEALNALSDVQPPAVVADAPKLVNRWVLGAGAGAALLLVFTFFWVMKPAADTALLRLNAGATPNALLKRQEPVHDVVPPNHELDVGPPDLAEHTIDPTPFEPGGLVRELQDPEAGERRYVFVLIPEGFDPKRDPKLLMVAGNGDHQKPQEVLAYYDLIEGARERNIVIVMPRPEYPSLITEDNWSAEAVSAAMKDLRAVRHTLGLADAPLFGIGEARAARAFDLFDCEGEKFAAVATLSYGYKQREKLCDAPGLSPRLTFWNPGERWLPVAGGYNRRKNGPWNSHAAMKQIQRDRYGAGRRATTQNEGGAECERWDSVSLEHCTVDGAADRSKWEGRLSSKPAAGREFPYTKVVWSFFDRMTKPD